MDAARQLLHAASANPANYNKDKTRRAALMSRLLSSLVRITMVLPCDAVLWSTEYTSYIPYVRLTRLAFAPGQVDAALQMLERSQALPFTLSHSVRVIAAL